MGVCTNGHVVAMPIYGRKKNVKNSSGRCHWNVVYIIWHSSTTKFVQMTFLCKAELLFGSLCICLVVDYSETIEVYDVKVSIVN